MIRKDNGSNNSLFLSCQMGLSDDAFFMIKHTPLPNGNHPISSPVFPMGVADTLEPDHHSLFCCAQAARQFISSRLDHEGDNCTMMMFSMLVSGYLTIALVDGKPNEFLFSLFSCKKVVICTDKNSN